MISSIPGYAYGHSSLVQSPVSGQDLALLKQTLLWSDDDDHHLRLAGAVLQDQTAAVLDLWYGYVGSQAHLIRYFAQDGPPDAGYLGAVRKRFEQWILDLCQQTYDQSWLDYQHEIALRHHSRKKNQTDGVAAVPIVHFRYLVAFIYPITITIRDFLAKKGHDAGTVDKMYNAWFKAVTLTTLLWCEPYVREGEF